MAITAANLVFTRDDGSVIPNGSLHALFGAARVGAATDYRFVTVTNTHATLTMSTVKVWLTSSGGAAVAIAIANGPQGTTDFAAVEASSLTYSAPSTKASGLATSPANLGPGQSFRIAVRRVFSSATAADPQTVRLSVGGTSPI